MLHGRTFHILRSEKNSTICYLVISWFYYLYLNTDIPGIYFRVQYGSNFIPKSSPIIVHHLVSNLLLTFDMLSYTTRDRVSGISIPFIYLITLGKKIPLLLMYLYNLF